MKSRLFLLLILVLVVSLSVAQSFNYTYTDGNLGSTYSWIDCSPANNGNEVQDNEWEQNIGLGDKKDDGYTMIEWPFAFQFYDSYYFPGDEMSVCSNGFIRFDGIADDDASNVYDKSLSYDLGLGEIVSLAMEDCGFENANSHLYYKTTGTAPNRVFTVEMNQVEIRYDENKYADVQVSFYETSNIIVLKFGTENINYSAYMGIHSGSNSYWNSYYNKWQNLNGASQNRWRAYTPPAKSFDSDDDLTITQASTDNLGPSNNNPILKLQYDVYGGSGALDLNSIVVNAVNDDNADVGAVRLFHTTENVFSTEHQVGSSVYVTGNTYNFSNLNYNIPGGVSYLWITYDINSTATSGNTVDGKILSGNINASSGNAYPSSNNSPYGNREVSFFKWDGSTSTNWSVASNWSTNSIPTSSDNVYIPSSPTNQPHLLTTVIGKCNDLTIETGAKLTIENDNKNLRIYGSIINDGVMDVMGSNNILLYASNGTIEGSGSFNSAKFRLRSNSTYTLYKDINVYKLLLDDGCTVNIGDYNVSCNNTFNSKSGSTITIGSGSISATASLKLDGNFTAGTGTVIYAGANGQAISNVDYYNLKVKVTGNSRTLTNVSDNFHNLEIYSETSGKAKLASPLETDGNITVDENCILDLNNQNIIIEKDFTNDGSITFGSNTVTFDGKGSSHIYGSSNFYNLVIDKSTGDVYIENGDNRVSNNLSLTNGIVFANNTPLVVEDGCTTTGGSVDSYVDGKLMKIGNDAYLFHVGDFRKYAPIEISAPASVTSEFTTHYHKNAYSSSNVESPLSKVSGKEYWDLDNTGTAATVDVTLYWKDGSYSGIGDLSDLRLAHYNGSIWESLGVNGTTGNTSTGSIRVNNVSSFSPFTFGTLSNITNPLPVSLVDFDVKKIDNTAYIQWTTASEINNDYFIVQRSVDGENIENIGEINGAGNSNKVLKYSFIDNNPPKGMVYYRLKQVDFDGKNEIFEWKSLFFNNEEELKIYPIPNNDGILNLTYSNINNDAQISIYSMDGKLVFNKQILFANGEAVLNFNLTKGCYIVKTMFDNDLFTRRLIVK